MLETIPPKHVQVGDILTLKQQEGLYLFFRFMGGGRLKVCPIRDYRLGAPFTTSFNRINAVTGKHWDKDEVIKNLQQFPPPKIKTSKLVEEAIQSFDEARPFEF